MLLWCKKMLMPKRKNMGRRCCVVGCASTSRLPEHHGVTYHSFPLDRDTRAIWIRNTRLNIERQITKSVLVCSRHFRRIDFQPQRSGKFLLKHKVFPTVFPWGKVDAAQIEADMEFLSKTLGTSLKPSTGRQSFISSNSPNSPVDDDTKAAVEATVAQIMAEARARENAEKINQRSDNSISANVKFERVTTFTPGIRLEAQDFDGVWHSVRVVEVDNDDGEVLIKFEKTSKNKSAVVGCEEWIPMDSTRLRQKTSNKPIPVFNLEEKCMARWSGPKKFPGTVKKLLANDTYEVLFDDGYIKNVRAIHMNKMHMSTEEDALEDNSIKTTISCTNSIVNNTEMKSSTLSEEPTASNKNRSYSNKRNWPLLDMSNLDLASLNLPEIPKDGEWSCHWVNDQPIGQEGYLVVGEHRKPTVIVEDWRLPTGWVKHMYQRSNVLGKWDVILVSPTGKRFRSKADLKVFLEEQNQTYNPDIYDFSIHRRRAKDINCYVYTRDYVPIQPKLNPSIYTKVETTTNNQVSSCLLNDIPSTSDASFLETPITELEPPMELLTNSKANEDKNITQVDSEVPKQLLEVVESHSTPITLSTFPPLIKEDKQNLKNLTNEQPLIKTEKSVGDDDYALIGGLRVQIIDNLFRCPQEGCSKNFRKENHLQIHVKHYHQDLNKLLGSCPKMLELAEKRTHPSKSDITEAVPKNQIPNQQFFAKLHQQDLEQTRSHRRSQGIMIKPQTPDNESKIPYMKSVAEIVEGDIVLPNSTSSDSPVMQNKFETDHADDSVLQSKVDEDCYEGSVPKKMKHSPNSRNAISRKSSRQRTTRQYLTAAQASVGSVTFSSLMGTGGDSNFVGTTDSEETRHSFNATPDHSKDTKKRKSTQAPITPLSGIGSPMTADSGSAGSFPAPTTDVDTSNAQTPQYIKENGELIKIVSMRQEEIINCLCGYCEEDGLMIQCELCLCWQHGFCNGIGKESQVPEKYVCYICRNPQCARDSLRFKHDQDWLFDGKLPLANYYQKNSAIINEKALILKKSHILTGNLLELNNYMHSLRVKINIANNKYHPKLYLWDKNWDAEAMKSELKKDNCNNSPTTLTTVNSTDQGRHGLHSKKIKLEPSTPIKPTPNIPQPEAAIDTDKCQQRLLEHIKIQQELVWSRLKEIEAAICDLERCDTLEDLKSDGVSVIRDVLSSFIKDLHTVKQIAKLNTLEHTIKVNKEITSAPSTK